MRRLLATVAGIAGGVTMLVAVGWVAIAGAIIGEGMSRPGRKK